MTKTKEVEVQAKTEANTYNDIARLAIKTFTKEVEDGAMTVHRLHVQGSESEANKVLFRPFKLVNKLIKMVQTDDGGWKAIGETVFFDNFYGDITDTQGGNALGRVFGKKASELSAAEFEANKKKATFYGFLFGEVKFGNEDWKLVNFRLTGGKAKEFGDSMRGIKDKALWPTTTVELSVKPNARPQYADLVTSIVGTDGSTEGVSDTLAKIDAFIAAHDERIRDYASRKNGGKADSELLEDLSDEIPF